MRFGGVARRYGFDAEGGRMLDTWWPEGRRDLAVTQSLRSYGPADVRPLLAGTGLKLADIDPGGAMDWEADVYRTAAPLGEAVSFFARLERLARP